MKFIGSFRFLSSSLSLDLCQAHSLSSLVDNLSEGLHSDKCTDCKSCLDYMVFKDYQFECKTIY